MLSGAAIALIIVGLLVLGGIIAGVVWVAECDRTPRPMKLVMSPSPNPMATTFSWEQGAPCKGWKKKRPVGFIVNKIDIQQYDETAKKYKNFSEHNVVGNTISVELPAGKYKVCVRSQWGCDRISRSLTGTFTVKSPIGISPMMSSAAPAGSPMMAPAAPMGMEANRVGAFDMDGEMPVYEDADVPADFGQ